MIIACPRCEASYAVDFAVFGARARIVQCSACHHRWPQTGKADIERERPELAPARSTSRGGVDSPTVVEPLLVHSRQPAAVVTPSLPSSDDGEITRAEALVSDPGEDKLVRLTEAVHPPALSPDNAAAECDSTSSEAAPAEPVRPRVRRDGRVLIGATAAAATVLSVMALLILLRGPVVSTMPDAAKLYGLIGLAPDPLGRGLQIRDIASAQERVGGQDVLRVTGMVANVVQSREALPTLRITLFDAADQELQWVTVPPALESLDPGQTLPFEAEIKAPSPAAHLLRVGFAASPN